MGTENRNQNDIITDAHDGKIVQIVTLAGQKLENKYFATKCIFGDLSIWSATPHPDKVFTIEYVDQDESNPRIGDYSMPIEPPPLRERGPTGKKRLQRNNSGHGHKKPCEYKGRKQSGKPS